MVSPKKRPSYLVLMIEASKRESMKVLPPMMSSGGVGARPKTPSKFKEPFRL